MMTKSRIPEEVSTDDFANLIGVTSRTVRNYIKDGIITSGVRGKVKLSASVQGVIASAKASRPDSVLDRARARALDARTRAAELRIAREQRELIPMDDAMTAVETIAGAANTAFSTIPARFSRDLSAREKLEDLIFQVRTEFSARLHELAEQARTGKFEENYNED